jgi:nicotinamidase-related amidase
LALALKSALLVIDVQRILTEGRDAAFEVDRVIERINAMSRKARTASAPVIFVQHETRSEEMRRGTTPWQLAPTLEVRPGDHHVRKTATDSFHRTTLQSLLDNLGITRLVVCGLQSDYCVDTTTRRALALGYPVTLVSDAHSTVDNGILAAPQIIAHHSWTLSNIDSFDVRAVLVPAADVSFAA